MQKLLKTLGKGIICLSVIAVTDACFGADSPRGAANNNRGRGAVSSARMPSIPADRRIQGYWQVPKNT